MKKELLNPNSQWLVQKELLISESVTALLKVYTVFYIAFYDIKNTSRL